MAYDEKTMIFRQVLVPPKVKGKLYLHSMLGRYETLRTSLEEIERLAINGILSLASLEEIENKSPQYVEAIKSNLLSCEYLPFPITDYDVPTDRQEFGVFVENAARRLHKGERLLLHCGAGIGRTGTVACCILIELGLSQDNAERSVDAAGSHPETTDQKALVDWYAKKKETREGDSNGDVYL